MATEQQELKKRIEEELVRSGEKERLQILFRNKLSESEWSIQMQKKCEELIRLKGGPQKVSPDLLAQELFSTAKESIPSQIQHDIVNQLKDFVDKKISL
jgi:hypothetical protein